MKLNINQNKQSTRKLDDSMIPAINIVFLLLIFFMIAGKIETRDSQLLIPKSTSDVKFEKKEVNIKVMPNGEYTVNGEKLQDTLIKKFESMLLKEDSIITCYIHNELPISKLDPVLEAIQALGIKQINIATQRY